MSSSQKQLTLFVTFRVAPESVRAFLDAHRPVWAACAREPECLLFDVFQDPEDPGRFRFVEVWSKDREWFETVRCSFLATLHVAAKVLVVDANWQEQKQMTKPYYETLWAKSKPLWIEEPKLEYFERFGEGSVYADEYLAGGRKI